MMIKMFIFTLLSLSLHSYANTTDLELENAYEQISRLSRELEVSQERNLNLEQRISTQQSAPERGNVGFGHLYLYAFGGLCLTTLFFVMRSKKPSIQKTTPQKPGVKKVKIISCAEKSFETAIEGYKFSTYAKENAIQKRESNPFSTTVLVNEATFHSGVQEYLKGIDSIIKFSSKPVVIEWGTQKEGERLCIETVLHGLSIDSNSIFSNAIMDGNTSAAASFTRAEKIFKNLSPNIVLNKYPESTKIRFEFYTQTAQRQNVLSH